MIVGRNLDELSWLWQFLINRSLPEELSHDLAQFYSFDGRLGPPGYGGSSAMHSEPARTAHPASRGEGYGHVAPGVHQEGVSDR